MHPPGSSMYTALISFILLTGYWGLASNTLIKSCISKVGFRNKEIEAPFQWNHSNVHSLLKCAVECYSVHNCRTCSFSHLKKVCLDYIKALKAYKNKMADVPEGETILFQTRRGYIGSSCSQSDECNIQKSVCSYGVCLCEPGIYYSPKYNSCTRNCSEYGEEMDVYKNRNIKRHNKRRFWHLSVSACKQRCIHERSFLCLTFDYNYKTRACFLAEVGYMDVLENDRLHWDRVALGQRRCK